MHPSGGVTRQPVPAAPERFPFDAGFQQALLRLICDDDAFARAVQAHLKPAFFEGEVLQWAYAWMQRYYAQYRQMPGIRVVVQQTRGLDARIRPMYAATLEQVIAAPARDDVWLKNAVLDFIKRNVFVRAHVEARELYNAGKVDAAYDLTMREMDRIRRTTWETVDRSDFFAELHQREARRVSYNPMADSIPTGWGWLDHILSGGLSLGEVGYWLAYPKSGKSTVLVTFGKNAVRLAYKRTLHVVLEGTRQQVEARYDTSFSGEMYSEIKHGGFKDAGAYARLMNEYQLLRGNLIVRGFTDRWNYTIEDIQGEIEDLKSEKGWKPELVIVDYLDLMSGRNGPYRGETDKQRDAARDLKSFANRGYAVWSATQAQRPKEGQEEVAHRLMARQIADCYDKVRTADFLGSLNQTKNERAACQLRAFAELYRDNEAGVEKLLKADFARMSIHEEEGLVPVETSAGVTTTAPLGGYTQRLAPVSSR